MQNNKHNTTHKQNKGQKQNDNFNKCRKAFDKIHHLFTTKGLKKLEIEGTYVNILKVIWAKFIGNITLNKDELKAFLLKSREADFYSLHYYSI
jgi:hypothetical protein